MDSQSPLREERNGRSPTLSSYTRSPSPPRRKRSDSRSLSPPPRRYGTSGRGRSDSVSKSRSRSRSYSRDRDSRERSESPLRGSTKIVIEKLTKNINEEHLREVFGRYGTIKDMHLPMSRQFNTNRGVAYILYIHEADAEAAIAHMHEGILDGAVINVSIVFPRRKFSPAPPTATRGANIDPRVPPPRGPGGGGGRRGRGPQGGFGGGFGGPGSGRGRARSPPTYENSYRPARTPSRSRSPPRRRHSPSYDSRSRSPQPKRSGGKGKRDSFEGDHDRGDRRRSPSYDSYRSRSRSRGRGYR